MRIMAKQINLGLYSAFFQFLELFVVDNINHLGYVIICYYKNEEEAVKLYKNNLYFKGCATSTTCIKHRGFSGLLDVSHASSFCVGG
jgi:hypothetical protein